MNHRQSRGFYRRAVTAALVSIAALAFGASGSRAADHVKAGVVRSMGGSPAFIAKEKGYFAAEGIDLELVFFDAAQPISVAVASGDIDFGNTGLTAAFFNLAAQGALRILTSGTWETPGFQSVGFLVSNQAYAAGLKSLKDIGGHSAAITQSGTPLHYLLALAADKYHIDFNTIKILLLQSNPNVGSALTGGQTDIAVQTVAPAYNVIEKGGARLLGWAGDELGRSQSEALFTSIKTANERGDLVKRYLRAYRKAMAYFHDAFADVNDTRRDGPTAPDVVAIAAKYLGQAPEVIKKGLPFFDPQGRVVAGDFVQVAEWYREQGMLKGELDVKGLIDKRYALAVVPK